MWVDEHGIHWAMAEWMLDAVSGDSFYDVYWQCMAARHR
jgi:hypothetical protein